MISIVDAAYNNFSVFSCVLESDYVIRDENGLLSRVVTEKNNWPRIKSVFDHGLGFYITG